MRLLVLNPFSATEPGAEKTFAGIARADVDVRVENIKSVYPLDYVTWGYNTLKATNSTVERIIKAEGEGYDGVFISCMYDPGLYESRHVVDIPVAGAMESSVLFASMMGKKFSLLTLPPPVPQIEMALIERYGLKDRVASVRYIDIIANKLYPEVTKPSVVKDKTVKAMNQCLEDGAEVIVPGCTILGAVLTQYFNEELKSMPVPVIDPMVVGFKTLEMMADLRTQGYPTISRTGLWKKQPKEEFKGLREWSREHPSPEQFYQGVAKRVTA